MDNAESVKLFYLSYNPIYLQDAMKIARFSLFTTIVIFLLACSGNYNELLVGTWRNDVEFGKSAHTYNADGSYLFEYSHGANDTGTWRIDGSTLYLKQIDDDFEFEQELTQLNDDKMVILMAGRFESSYSRTN
ncbi:MAG: hypothetical protein JKY54_07080 [Flavobacteriales bacterium]|nr:hypothetical protein [Flavobacteriales bacterium]